MALPLASAVPLMVFLTILPRLPVGKGAFVASEMRVFTVGTLMGLPIALCAVGAGACVLRSRMKPVVTLAGLMVVTTLAVAAGWLLIDVRSMAGIEHYESGGWYLVFLPGAYVAACLWVVGWAILGGYKLVRRGTRGGGDRRAGPPLPPL